MWVKTICFQVNSCCKSRPAICLRPAMRTEKPQRHERPHGGPDRDVFSLQLSNATATMAQTEQRSHKNHRNERLKSFHGDIPKQACLWFEWVHLFIRWFVVHESSTEQKENISLNDGTSVASEIGFLTWRCRAIWTCHIIHSHYPILLFVFSWVSPGTGRREVGTEECGNIRANLIKRLAKAILFQTKHICERGLLTSRSEGSKLEHVAGTCEIPLSQLGLKYCVYF